MSRLGEAERRTWQTQQHKAGLSGRRTLRTSGIGDEAQKRRIASRRARGSSGKDRMVGQPSTTARGPTKANMPARVFIAFSSLQGGSVNS